MTYNLPNILLQEKYNNFWVLENGEILLLEKATKGFRAKLESATDTIHINITLDNLEDWCANMGGGLPSFVLDKIEADILKYEARPIEEEILHMAIEFAAAAHAKQTRKGSKIPYLAHPFAVAMALQRENANTAVVIAGLLHDTVEDTDVTLEQIEMIFGSRVAELVASCSEDKTKCWKERKTHTIDFLENCTDRDILLLSCTDKTANLRSMKLDLENIGEALWDRFNASKREISWYYSKLNDAFSALGNCYAFRENSNLYQDIFVKFYLDGEKNYSYQTNGEEAYLCDRCAVWEAMDAEALNDMIKSAQVIKTTNTEAYKLEKYWRESSEKE